MITGLAFVGKHGEVVVAAAYDFEEVAAGSVIGDEWNISFGLGAPIYTVDLDENGTSDLIIGDYNYDNTDLTSDGPEGGVFVFYNTNE